MSQSRDMSAGGRLRIVGIDLGERRIGVAIGDPAALTASPFAALVVGLPINMDGSEGPQAARTREWAEAVAAATGLALRYRDERLTSERAGSRIGKAGRGRSGGPPSPARREAYRARIDREAAALILQDDLDATSVERGEWRPG